MIASGTNGTCTWTISDAGELSIRPTSGNSGYLLSGWMLTNWPWQDYAEEVRSAVFSGSIYFYKEQLSGQPIETGNAQYLFEVIDRFIVSETQYSNLTSITGFGSLKNLVDISEMFGGCTALTTLDLSSLDTTNVTRLSGMFSGCNLLSSVTFGNLFSTDNVENYENPFFGKGTNTTNGIIVQSDADFMKLTASQRAGTWERGVAPSYSAVAFRTAGGVPDTSGEDVEIDVTWATDASTTTRTLKIYKKLSSTASYPSTPIVTQNLIGDSGITPITILNVGDEAYDFKVTFYDGVNTFIAFPTIQSNVRLITIDEKGRVECGDYGGNLKSIFDIFYPVGSYYETSLPNAIPSGESTPTDTDLANLGTTWFNPKYAWGGEWSLETAGLVHVSGATNHAKYPVSSTYTDANNGAGKKQDGDKDAIIPYHNHTATGGAVNEKDAITITSSGDHSHNGTRRPIMTTKTSGSAAFVGSETTGSDTSSTRVTRSDSMGTHTHSVPKHTHGFTQPTISYAGDPDNTLDANMQPYINVYRWHRTA